LMKGKGCSHCNGTGFSGRRGVYELLEMSEELVAAVSEADPAAFIRAARAKLAGQTLRSNGLRLALLGKTTVGEAMRVTSQAED
jgi:MSHA biogenesis protein MshE